MTNLRVPNLFRRVVCGLSICIFPVTTVDLSAAEKTPFQTDVLPILKRNCFKCHGVSKKEGELQLHSAVRVFRGGTTGPAVVPKDLDKSLLWQRVSQNEMPPEHPLTNAEKTILKDWIADGAIGLPADEAAATAMQKDEHWAFTRLQSPTLPPVKKPQACRTPIDRFIAAELDRAGLPFNPEADRNTLIRRVSFTLTGLPPTPDEIATFLADESPDAYEAMVERYLASPQYGVRWGKYWLDAAGYADSNGYFNADSDRPLAYRYRDYVIRAINDDMPFDRFVREQMAGDELSGFDPNAHLTSATPEMIDLLVATHYLRNGQDGSGESDGNPDEVRIDRYTALESTQQIVASSLLGLTFQCAKCHDHKFEPVSQRDFYQFQSVFFPVFNLNSWLKPNERVTKANLPGVYERWKSQQSELEIQIAAMRTDLSDWIREHRLPGTIRFEDNFDDPSQLAVRWTNTIPGDDTHAGTAAIALLETESADVTQTPLPAAQVKNGTLQIIEGGASGDKFLSTKEVFDWTPDQPGSWIQVSFDLVDTKIGDGASAERIGYCIALHDFNDNSSVTGGNILIDGSPAGGGNLFLDYPGDDMAPSGAIGSAKYESGQNFGIRITHIEGGKFRMEHLVHGLPEGPHRDFEAADLPDGSFGFEFCCNRSFIVDRLVIETLAPVAADTKSKDGPTAEEVQQFSAEIQRRQEEISSRSKTLEELRGAEPGRISWVTDTLPEPPDVFLLDRGEYSQPKEKVTPTPIAALNEEDNPFGIIPQPNGVPSTGQRLAWANWVTREDSRAASLMARVQVNRVWQYHFGTGIVSTSENLGMSGSDPTHPELIDWLAYQFMKSEWSLKHIHRLILTSAVFRQASSAHDAGMEIDRFNRLWWRYPIRRLDAEAVRDTHLAISGDLEIMFSGPYVATTRNGAAEVVVPENQTGAHRRSIFLQQRRTQGLSMLNVFDAPTIVINCPRRPVTTMPLQSLNLLNSEFAVARGSHLAARIAAEGGDNSADRIRLAFLLATGREPSNVDLEESLQFLESQHKEYVELADPQQRAWSDFCQLLLASNACLYVE
ncbi:MAG: PSD1 and planctomycete cytochrome C domain-containing protein [Planctomycetaceae bacterium]